jgi:hypothetical protein
MWASSFPSLRVGDVEALFLFWGLELVFYFCLYVKWVPEIEVIFPNKQVVLWWKWAQLWNSQDESALSRGLADSSLDPLLAFIIDSPAASGLVSPWRCRQMSEENGKKVSGQKAPLRDT